jgi:hypothetical protein
MKLLKSITLLFIFLLLFLSCETPISLKIPEMKDTKIIEGWIENDRPATVIISKSLGYFSSVSVANILASIDTNAIVTVSDDMGNIEQLERPSYTDFLMTYPCPERILEHGFAFFMAPDIITRDTNALLLFGKELANKKTYAYVGKTIKGMPGHTYYLHVESAGKVYTAQTTIPLNTVQIDSFAFYKRGNDTTASLRIFLTDRPETYDCYRFFLKIDKLDWHYEQIYMGSFDDLTFNGKSAEYELLRRPQTNISIANMSSSAREDYYRAVFRTGDVIHVRSTMTDKATVDYWFPLQTDIETGSNPFMTPGTYITNIKGENVGGIWSGYHARYDTIRMEASTVLY